MTYVVTEICIGCKHTNCVEVCPVDCFYEGENFLAINPEECIDCGMCEPECPIEAIVSEADLDEQDLGLIALNGELAAHWLKITNKKDALPDATIWAERRDKLKLLIR
jgi:ferredoxin